MDTEKIPVTLSNGAIVHFEGFQQGRQEVSFKSFAFEDVANILEGVSSSIKASIETVKPHKASIKFGVEIGVESGNLTAVIVQGVSKANLEITLEWENPRES